MPRLINDIRRHRKAASVAEPVTQAVENFAALPNALLGKVPLQATIQTGGEGITEDERPSADLEGSQRFDRDEHEPEQGGDDQLDRASVESATWRPSPAPSRRTTNSIFTVPHPASIMTAWWHIPACRKAEGARSRVPGVRSGSSAPNGDCLLWVYFVEKLG